MKNFKILISRIADAAKVLILGSMVAMTCSCEDFLTISPTDKIILEDFWKTKDDVNNVLAESYRLMASSNFLNRLIVWGELRSDNVVEGNYGGNNDIKYIMEANLLPNNGYASWDVFYKVINNCNIVLKYAPGVLDEDPDFSQGDLDVVRGEMLAMRALCHFYLVRTFRRVPLLTEAMVDNSQNLKQAQEEPLVVLDSCLVDLYKAQDLVLTSGNFPNAANNKGRITKDAVRTMIADVLLWKAAFLQYEKKTAEAKACYTECVVYCDSVLNTRMRYIRNYDKEVNENYIQKQLGLDLHVSYPIFYPLDKTKGGYGYELPNTENSGKNRVAHSIYNHIFQGNSLCEGIFEIQHTSESQAANYEVPTFYGYYDDTKFVTSLLSAPRYMAEVDVTGSIYAKSDYRRINYILSQKKDNEELDKYSIIKYGYMSWNEDRKDLSSSETTTFGKISYTYTPSVSSGGGRYLELSTNWILYRVTDVMLMKAEALALRNEGGDSDVAFELVEAVYERSQAGYMNNSGSVVGELDGKDAFTRDGERNKGKDILEIVLEERQRELAFEGKRWYDLVRKALRDGDTKPMLDILVPHKYESNGDAYRAKLADLNSLFFPIAEREINTNELLVQNPAYEVDDLYEKN